MPTKAQATMFAGSTDVSISQSFTDCDVVVASFENVSDVLVERGECQMKPRDPRCGSRKRLDSCER